MQPESQLATSKARKSGPLRSGASSWIQTFLKLVVWRIFDLLFVTLIFSDKLFLIIFNRNHFISENVGIEIGLVLPQSGAVRLKVCWLVYFGDTFLRGIITYLTSSLVFMWWKADLVWFGFPLSLLFVLFVTQVINTPSPSVFTRVKLV